MTTIKTYFKTTLYEGSKFFFGIIIGVYVGFMMAFFYLIMPWGVP